MNNDSAICANKNCPIAAKCGRNDRSGPQSDMQWMAAFAPHYDADLGIYLCEGLVAKKVTGEHDET